jgi:hypothetical protein
VEAIRSEEEEEEVLEGSHWAEEGAEEDSASVA